jgi:heavy metal sensor kinase
MGSPVKRKRTTSIRTRLTLWYALILGLVFLVSDIVLYQGFKLSLRDTMDEALLTAAEEVEESISRLKPQKWGQAVKGVERGFKVNRMFIQVVKSTPDKEEPFYILTRSGVLSGNISQKEIWKQLSNRLPDKPVYLDVVEDSPSKHPLRIILYPVRISESRNYLVEVGTSLRKHITTLDNFLIILAVSGPLLLLIVVFGGYWILSRAFEPVNRVVHTAGLISAEDLSLRIEAGRYPDDEVGELITTFNSMIARLENSVDQLKQFTSDASHDLKTPLTVIRGEIEVALRSERSKEEYVKTLTSVIEESRKLERIIDDLLFLSRLDHDTPAFTRETLALDEVLLQLFEKTQPLAAEKGIAYVLRRIDNVRVMVSPIMLERLLMNLLDNAIKYTPNGGRVDITLTRENSRAILSIRDSGCGIPAESLPHVYERFYRVVNSPAHRGKGAGLGLSIVKKIALLHHFEVELDSKPDVGTTTRVLFPLMAPLA